MIFYRVVFNFNVSNMIKRLIVIHFFSFCIFFICVWKRCLLIVFRTFRSRAFIWNLCSVVYIYPVEPNVCFHSTFTDSVLGEYMDDAKTSDFHIKPRHLLNATTQPRFLNHFFPFFPMHYGCKNERCWLKKLFKYFFFFLPFKYLTITARLKD